MNENMNKEQVSASAGMPNNNNQKACRFCGGQNCFCGRRFLWLRLLLGVIVLAAVFCIGVKVGEFKAEFRGRGGYMMRSYRQPMRGYPMGMPSGVMRTGTSQMMTQPTATTTPAK
jgi:hypothetical protein